MNDFIEQLKHQEKLHRKSGANGLADLFMNAAEGLEQQQQEIRELESVNTDAVKALAERNTLVTYVEVLRDALEPYAQLELLEGEGANKAINALKQSLQASLAEHNSDVAYNAIKFCLSEIARDNRLDEYNPTNDAKVILESYNGVIK